MSDPNENEPGAARSVPDRPGPPDGGVGGRRRRIGDGEGWSGRVTVVPGPDGFAYVPGDVLSTDPERTLEVARRVFPRWDLRVVDPDDDAELRDTPVR
ncbi:MAG TPA: hypothetical protein VFY82_06805, partial [Acidimicrobiales bacterium]|nr:hypothetical protein [Acidimicrobiales bacterium]